MELRKKIPNYLTLLRVALIPFLIVSFYFEEGVRYITASIFVIASITDFFDGYLSRKWEVTSKFGELMDPIADKLIVATALILIVASDDSNMIAAIGIMCREIYISGLREYTAKHEVNVPVTKLAKWKTALQMFAIILLLAATGAIGSPIYYIGSVSLWLAFAITFYTGFLYYKSAKEEGLF